MAFAENEGVRLYWDDEGNGAPLLLIMGLGRASNAWHRMRPLLSERYRTIAFDNRGVGRSDAPAGPYTIGQMASDAAAVLRAAGVNAAHVLGLSMGGMIAQEFALKYPSKVRSLILGCTSPGGAEAVRAEEAVQQILTAPHSDAEEFAAALRPFAYDSTTPAQRIEEDMVARRKWLPAPEAYSAQLQAIRAWEGYSRIAEIRAPTLVIHGENDRMIPVANAKLIAAQIPSAKLVLLAKASHIFGTDQTEAANAAILDFLGAQATRKKERLAPV